MAWARDSDEPDGLQRQWSRLRLPVRLFLTQSAVAGPVLLAAWLGSGASGASGQAWQPVAVLALMSLATSMAGSVYLARALRPLSKLQRFANVLSQQPGAQTPKEGSSPEVRELCSALNDASAMLRLQGDGLVANQARTRDILNAVPDVILGLDDRGCIDIVNLSVSSVFGVPPEEMRGMPLAQVLPGLDLKAVDEHTLQGLYMRATRTHIARLEASARRLDGTSFPVDVSLSRIETDDGIRYAAVVRDATEQRMTQEMLNLYSRALECTSNGVVIRDMRLPGSPVFYANPAFERITGYARWEVIGSNCRMLRRDDDNQPEQDILRQAVIERRSAQVVMRNYRKDGTLFFNELAIAPVASADGSVPHYVGVITDVTERERARLAIAERSARLNAVFELSPDGFVVFDSQGRLAYNNRAFEEMTGWAPAAEGQGVMTVQDFDQRFAGLCEVGAPCVPVQMVLDAQTAAPGVADGADTVLLAIPERRVLARVVRSHVEGHEESILFFRDVTRETEVDRMKSEFLTTAAHELRTPMVSVFGFTELLLRRPVPEARRRDMLETIHRQASLLINMVNELLDLARIEARQGKDLKRQVCRIDSLVTQAVGPLVVSPGVHQFEVDVPDGGRELWVDPEKMLRALVNVLGNAVKYSPAGGLIQVRALNGELRGAPAVGLLIADPGIGMSPDQMARIFERFYRADPSGNIPGTGLGMSLVKEIVELQGGRVDVASCLGQGTAVTMWLPLHQPATDLQPA